MRKFVAPFLNFLAAQSVFTRQTLIFGVLLLVGVLDYMTGVAVSLSFLYLIPVSLAAWTLDRNTGVLFAGLSALVWFLAVFPSWNEYSTTGILVWNALNRMGIFIVVVYLLFAFQESLEFERQMARTDSLTGTLNRRAFLEVVNLELARIQRHGHPATLLYLGLDNLRKIDDLAGLQARDVVLERVSRTLVQNLRIIDTVARLAEEVFVVLLPETGEVAAKVIAPRLQWHLNTEVGNHRWPVTFSMGVVTYLHPPTDIEEIIKITDRLVLEAKQPGKDGIHYEVIKGIAED